MKKALIVVDVQRDFCENGALEVTGAREIIPYINLLMEENQYDQIVFSQDFHPANHKSFAKNNNKNVGETIELNGVSQMMWPEHCVQGTSGVEFHPDIDISKATHIVKKGENPDIDSYSAFYDNQKLQSTGLADFLKYHEIVLVEIVGLALDYCVKYTCLDAVSEGFITCLHFNGTKAVNVKPVNGRDAIYELLQNSVTVLG